MSSQTLLVDIDLDAPPVEPLRLGGRSRVRALVWQGTRPLGEFVLDAHDEVAPAQLLAEAARLEPPPAPHEPPNPLPSVTVAVCTHDRPLDLAACLASLAAQADPPPHELLIVDNAPGDPGTRAAVDAHPGARYAAEPLPGSGFARNRALAEARGDVLAFLDDDAVAPPGWLRSVATTFASDPRVGAASGPVVPVELETEAQELFERRGGFTRTFEPLLLGRDAPERHASRHWPLLAVPFGMLAFRMSALRELGGFDDALGAGTPSRGGEDHDAIFRLLAAGHLFAYEPATLVRHRHRRELGSLTGQMESWGCGTMSFLMKCRASGSAPGSKVWLAVAWLLAHQVRRLLRSVLGGAPDRFPPSLVLAELRGCVHGFRAYHRSQEHVRRLRANAAAPTA